MARPKSKTLVTEWEEDLVRAEMFREDYGHCKDWAVYRDYYRGRFAPQGMSGRTNLKLLLPYNITYSFHQVMAPNLYYRDPAVFISSRRPGMETMAKVVESLDNWLIREIGLKKEVRKALLHVYTCGKALFKIGYDSFLSPEEEKAQEEAKEVESMLLGPDGGLGGLGGLGSGPSVSGMPWVKAIDPDFILVPFGSTCVEDLDWVDHIVLKRLDKAKEDKKYKNTSDLKGSHLTRILQNTNKSEYFRRLCEKNVDYIELHEIRDARSEEILCLVYGYDKFLRGPEEDVLQIEGLPYVELSFNDDPEYFWCTPDAAYIEPQQLEMNESRTQAMKHRRIALLKFLVREGAMDASEMDKMLSEHAGVAAKVKGIPSEVVSLLQPHLPQDIALWTDLIRDDAREILGIGKVQSGQETGGRKTATEIDRVQSAHDLRLGDRRSVVGDAIVDILRKMNQIIFTFWGQDKVIQVVGEDGARYWVKLSPDQIKGEYDMKVDVESAVPQSKEQRKKEIIQLIQAVGNNPNVNMDYLFRALLSEFEWIDVMKLLPPAPEGQVPMGTQDFARQQGQLRGNKELMQRRQRQVASQIPIGQLSKMMEGARG